MTLFPVVILAGGLGTRIQKVSRGKPKALIDVLGKPFLYWKLNELIQQGISEIYILGHVEALQIQKFLDTFDAGGTIITFIDDGEEPKGTAGAVLSALAQLPERFILTYGDNLLPQRVEEFMEKYNSLEKPNLLVLTKKITSSDKPNTCVKGDLVSAYSKRPLPGTDLDFLEYGYSVWSKEAFINYSSDVFPLDMATIIVGCIQERSLSAFTTEDEYFEIGTPEGLARTEKWLAANNS